MVEAEGARSKRDRGDEKDSVDVGHVVYDGLLQMAEVVLFLVPQPVLFKEVRGLHVLDELPVLLDEVEAELKECGGQDESVHSIV